MCVPFLYVQISMNFDNRVIEIDDDNMEQIDFNSNFLHDD